jgi:hypothetical protein
LALGSAQNGGNLHHLDTLDGVGDILGSEFEKMIGPYAQNLILENIAQHFVIAETVIARRTAADHAGRSDLHSAHVVLSNAAAAARQASLDADVMELERSRADLTEDRLPTTKSMKSRASARSRTRRYPNP